MLPFFWLVALLLCAVALVYNGAALWAALRAHQPQLAALSAFALLGLFACAWARGGASLVPSGSLPFLGPVLLIALSLVLGATGAVIVGRASSSKAKAGQLVRVSAVHLTLLLGSLVFLVPFAWLVSTSLKTDDEMAVFPPVWIPTQQLRDAKILRPASDERKAKLGQTEGAPLSWYRRADSGAKTRVAELADLPSGDVQVQPVSANGDRIGPAFTATRAQLEKIRRSSPRWENYSDALTYLPPDTHYGLTFLLNTLIITILSVIGTLFSSSLVAYSFARLSWPGKDSFFVLLLATLMVPGAVTLMPQFLLFRGLGWVDTLLPLWVPAFFASAFNVFLLRQFFLSIPGELEDAAKIDGCGPFGVYWRVMLPLVKPALAAIAIFATLGAWNNFQGPLIYVSSPQKMPLAYALQLYQQQHGGEPGLLMAASTLVVLPIIVLFFFAQRYFIEGASLSGLGGR